MIVLGGVLVVGALIAWLLIAPKQSAAVESSSEPSIAPASTPKYPYQAEVFRAAEYYNIDPDLIAAIISWEQRSDTKWDPNAVNPSDPSYGLGQVTPYIGARFSIIPSESAYEELFDPLKNCMAVAAFLSYCYNGQKYDLEKTIQIYNEGEPNYWNGKRVPDYLNGVMGYYRKFRGY